MAQNRNIYTSHKQFLAQISSVFTELINFSILLIFFSLHVFCILQQMDLSHHFLAAFCFLLLIIVKQYISCPSPVYLLDFSCLKPPDSCRAPISTYLEHARKFEFLDEESVSFIEKILTHSGQGEETYLPPAVHHIPPKSSQQAAIKEVHASLFPVLDDLLSKTKISPLEIDILIVNCSGFCPAPSLSSIIVNKYAMKEDIKSFTISGMGCSASALAIDLAQNILKTHRNSRALILSTEILSTGWYPGREQHMMVLNCLFRMGAAAILVSNKKEAKRKAKYKLMYTLRTQRSFDDKAYNSAMREEDSEGLTGVAFKRDLLQVTPKSPHLC